MSTVSFMKGMSKGITKITEMSYPKGTVVANVERFGGSYIPQEVVKAKRVRLSQDNPLYKAGLQAIHKNVTKNGTVHLEALNSGGEVVARGLENIKNLIKAIKNFGLKF